MIEYDDVLAQIDSYLTLGHNWNTYGARAPRPIEVTLARMAVIGLTQWCEIVEVSPRNDGGISLVVSLCGKEVAIDIEDGELDEVAATQHKSVADDGESR